MTRLDQIIDVQEDREITLQLPPSVEVGPHRVTVMVGPPVARPVSERDDHSHDQPDPRIIEKDGLLVLSGDEPSESQHLLEELRQERDHLLLGEAH